MADRATANPHAVRDLILQTVDHTEGVRTTVPVARSVDHDPPPHALGERTRRLRHIRLLLALASPKKLDGLQDGLSGSNTIKPHRFQELGQKAPYGTVTADELLVVPLASKACRRFPAIGCLQEFVVWDPREHPPTDLVVRNAFCEEHLTGFPKRERRSVELLKRADGFLLPQSLRLAQDIRQENIQEVERVIKGSNQ